jgi:hypothetical protein
LGFRLIPHKFKKLNYLQKFWVLVKNNSLALTSEWRPRFGSGLMIPSKELTLGQIDQALHSQTDVTLEGYEYDTLFSPEV